MAAKSPEAQPAVVEVPEEHRQTKTFYRSLGKIRKQGRKDLDRALHKMMRTDPHGTVRNVARDLFDLGERAVANQCFVTDSEVLFHVKLAIPKTKRVFVLDATANPELVARVVAPRGVRVVCNEPVQPAGRVIQFMDFNGPRRYLNKVPKKPVKIIDAIGDLHPHGRIVLISHRSSVKKLAEASRHATRIMTAHFGGLRGRNDLETSKAKPIACHIVMGSPKTTETARRQMALGVYGKDVLPFADLNTVRRAVAGPAPRDWSAGEGHVGIWEVILKGYDDPRMQAIYDQTVTAELTHAADRARVLIHHGATVYLVTNEPCPKLWFAERCMATDYLDLAPSNEGAQNRYEQAYQAYAAKTKELLDAGKIICNADVCRALERKPTWGHRYWRRFCKENGDAMEGERKKRWKPE